MPAPRSAVRPEIQALRAIAVLGVVLYHLWPERLPGGYVGVDVFFVISGFLIVGHLVRDASAGGISLLRFWARRARRLLPASLLVIVASGVATLIWVPDVVWQQWFEELAASAVYLQNWLLAANSVDYLGADNAASPAQHYWSLSVEEQFYIVWPLVIVAVLAIARVNRKRALFVTLAVITVASFAYSVYAVATDPSPAYFSTFTRAWEFGIGGLLAFAAPRTSAVASWVGLALIAASFALFDGDTVFPGATALVPVVGALAVIWGGMPRGSAALFRLAPVQWLGNISYSFYLWHWAPILIVPYALGHELTTIERVGILAGALVAAALTKRLIEDRFRAPAGVGGASAVRSLAATLAITVVVVAGCGAAVAQAAGRATDTAVAVEQALESNQPCLGAAAVSDDCYRPFAVTRLTDPAFAKTDIGVGVEATDDCKQVIDDAKVLRCEFGDTENPRRTIALFGDSHAGHFLAGLDDYAKHNGIRIVTMLKTWCNASGIDGITSPHASTASIASCAAWGSTAIDDLVADRSIDAVVFSTYSIRYSVDFDDRIGRLLTADDYESSLGRLADAGKQVIVIRSTPEPQKNIPDCIARHLDEYDPCAQRRDTVVIAETDDTVVTAARALDAPVIDITESLCGPTLCHWVIGGLIVYFDNSHLSSSFSRTLGEELGRQLERALE